MTLSALKASALRWPMVEVIFCQTFKTTIMLSDVFKVFIIVQGQVFVATQHDVAVSMTKGAHVMSIIVSPSSCGGISGIVQFSSRYSFSGIFNKICGCTLKVGFIRSSADIIINNFLRCVNDFQPVIRIAFHCTKTSCEVRQQVIEITGDVTIQRTLDIMFTKVTR